VGKHAAALGSYTRRAVPRRARHRARARARVLSVGAIVAVLLLGAGAGAFAVFSDTSSVDVTVGSGDIDVEWVSSGGAALTVPVGSILPGQSVERVVELRNTGTLPVGELQLAIAVANSNTSDGLQLAISDCSVPWTGTTTFTCGGVEAVVSADRPLLAVLALPTLGTNQAGGSDNLRLTFRLPTSAPSALQGASTNVTFEVLGNQGPGGNR
jgi:spore coat-associated protein N